MLTNSMFKQLKKIFRLNFSDVHHSLKMINPNRRSFGHKHDCLQNGSLYDIRMKKHLKTLSDEFLKLQENVKNGQELAKAERQLILKLEPLHAVMHELEDSENELKELETLISDLENREHGLLTAALDEKKKIELKIEQYKSMLIDYIIPDDDVDDKDIIMELSAGVGGQEAMLFTKNMFDMYCNYFSWKRWNYELLKYDATDLGGIRNAHIGVSGPQVYKFLKFESGVHRVQRVPKTEKAGRMHTSTMTVAVLPQPSEIDIVLNKKDIQFDFMRSSGPGGQNVNKTDSCVRVTHIPTGLYSECQMEREQYKNKELALKSLRTKLYEQELHKASLDTKMNRKLQVGTAGRSEKVRTYNFAQDRITDHRAHIQVFDTEAFFQGDEALEDLLNKLQSWNSVQLLHEILNKYD